MFLRSAGNLVLHAQKNPPHDLLCSGALMKRKDYFGAAVGAGVVLGGGTFSAVGVPGACGADVAEPVVAGDVVLAVFVALWRPKAKIPMMTARAMMPPMIQPV